MITFTFPSPGSAEPWQASVHGIERKELSEESLGWLHARAFIAANPLGAPTVDLQFSELMADLLAQIGRPLTADSEAAAEFKAWQEGRRAAGLPDDELTLPDFEHVILELHRARAVPQP